MCSEGTCEFARHFDCALHYTLRSFSFRAITPSVPVGTLDAFGAVGSGGQAYFGGRALWGFLPVF
jgi:hypothetical protein